MNAESKLLMVGSLFVNEHVIPDNGDVDLQNKRSESLVHDLKACIQTMMNEKYVLPQVLPAMGLRIGRDSEVSPIIVVHVYGHVTVIVNAF